MATQARRPPTLAPTSSFAEVLVQSGVSAVISKVAIAPIERVKLILQTQEVIPAVRQSQKQYVGIFDCFLRLMREEGFLSLWRGNMINIIRYAPNQAFNFAFNSLLQPYFCRYDQKRDYGKYMASYFVSGGLAGVVSMALFYPLDFLRTRVATDLGRPGAEREFNGMFDCLRKVYRSAGIQAFFSGISISFGVVFFYRGVYFGGAELGKREIRLVRENRAVKFVYYQLVTALAGLAVHPLDTVRRRMIVQSGRSCGTKDYHNVRDCIRQIYQKEGASGFFKGGLSNIYRGAGSALVMLIFDEIVGMKSQSAN